MPSRPVAKSHRDDGFRVRNRIDVSSSYLDPRLPVPSPGWPPIAPEDRDGAPLAGLRNRDDRAEHVAAIVNELFGCNEPNAVAVVLLKAACRAGRTQQERASPSVTVRSRRLRRAGRRAVWNACSRWPSCTSRAVLTRVAVIVLLPNVSCTLRCPIDDCARNRSAVANWSGHVGARVLSMFGTPLMAIPMMMRPGPRPPSLTSVSAGCFHCHISVALKSNRGSTGCSISAQECAG